MSRTCGDCTVCCFVGGVPELDKPAHSHCQYCWVSGCDLFGKPDRPKVCVDFCCSWLRGAGFPEDRPDTSGVMCSVNKMKGEKFSFVFVFEVAPGALLGKGKAIVERLTSLSSTPIIVVDHDSEPPEDKGDRVVVKDALAARSTRMMGKFLTYLDDDRSMGVYELVRGG